MATTITVTDETWNRLIKMKTRPSESFDKIINYLIDFNEVKKKDEIQVV